LADIFQEVDEDLRRDQYQKLWQKYGRYVVVLAVVIVGATAGVVGWREYSLRERQAEGARLAAAIDRARGGDHKGAAAEFAGLARDGAKGYAMLARFQEAGALASAGDAESALRAYEALARDESIDIVYRDLARLMSVAQRVDDGDPATLQSALQPLMADTNPWRHNATELAAVLALRQNDMTKARELLRRVADDAAAPNAVRARATELLSGLPS